MDDIFNQKVRVISVFVDMKCGIELKSSRVMSTMRELDAIKDIKIRNQEIQNIFQAAYCNIECKEKKNFAHRSTISINDMGCDSYF